MLRLRSNWAFFCLFLAGLLAWSVLVRLGFDQKNATPLVVVIVIVAALIMDMADVLLEAYRESRAKDRSRHD